MIELFDEMISCQERKLFKLATVLLPSITPDDLMQPNDFPLLENHPLFRYEEGVLEGLRTARMAYLAKEKDACIECSRNVY